MQRHLKNNSNGNGGSTLTTFDYSGIDVRGTKDRARP
jgi:hypothetical protein